MNARRRLNEQDKVENELVGQLVKMKWDHVVGDRDVPYLTFRESFSEVLLRDRLRDALRRVNLDENGAAWVTARQADSAILALERLGTGSLLERNRKATELLIGGTQVEPDSERTDKVETVRYIDFQHPERNEFLVINQFRVDPPGGRRSCIPDLVLFVNGIPLVVIECKSPAETNPMEKGIRDLLYYSSQREGVDEEEGVEKLFNYNQLMVSTYLYEARVGGIGSQFEHFSEWKDTSPIRTAEVARDLGVTQLNSQQTLVAGMLRPAHLTDILRNFILFAEIDGHVTKLVPRYQQFRAVHLAIERLRTGKTRMEDGIRDHRGGVIWHTQGSGKSFTMVFLVRKMRTLPDLKRFKVVAVTDRIPLQRQLSETAELTGEPIYLETSSRALQDRLRQPGSSLVFGTIQKYRVRDEDGEVVVGSDGSDDILFPELNRSPDILVMVDEAHRSHTNALHANLIRALPNAAKIGFTGTPILAADKKPTREIFGEFIDRYTIKQSEADGATVEILYEARRVRDEVSSPEVLDRAYAELFRGRTAAELELLKERFARPSVVHEAPARILAKAADILEHYVTTVLPNGTKAQLVASSREAAVRYQAALTGLHAELVRDLDQADEQLAQLDEEQLLRLDPRTRLVARAKAHEEVVRRLEFAAIISGAGKEDKPQFRRWTDPDLQAERIRRFKRPLVSSAPDKQDGLAIIIVKSMLLVGFDAPVEQAMYLDRAIEGHELLQAIARVNRRYANKAAGLVVDYFNVGRDLRDALAAYESEDIEGALVDLRDELPKLRDRHQRLIALFSEHGMSIGQEDDCVDLLRDPQVRADFAERLKQFLKSMDTVLPRPEALPYVSDAKRLGFINKAAANLYRDRSLDLELVRPGEKVKELIQRHISASGVDVLIEPVSILDADFEEVVDHRRSKRAKASEMEHAARQHIEGRLAEDPARYERLSERLDQILETFSDNWDALVEALREFTRELRDRPERDDTGLDPRTQAPFLGLLVEGQNIPLNDLSKYVEATVDLVDHIRQEVAVVDFWRNPHSQTVLRGWIVKYLDDSDLVPFDRQRALADRLLELARTLHTRLVT